jgi:hypothetical protein
MPTPLRFYRHLIPKKKELTKAGARYYENRAPAFEFFFLVWLVGQLHPIFTKS